MAGVAEAVCSPGPSRRSGRGSVQGVTQTGRCGHAPGPGLSRPSPVIAVSQPATRAGSAPASPASSPARFSADSRGPRPACGPSPRRGRRGPVPPPPCRARRCPATRTRPPGRPRGTARRSSPGTPDGGRGRPGRRGGRAAAAGLPAPARTQSSTQGSVAAGSRARTRSAAESALSGARVWVWTRAGGRVWAKPGTGGSMSYWLRSVTARRTGTGNRPTCRADFDQPAVRGRVGEVDVVHGEQQGGRLGVRAQEPPQRGGLFPLAAPQVLLGEARCRAEELEDGGEGHGGVAGRAPGAQHPHAVPGGVLGGGVQHGGPAGAGGAAQQHEAAGAGPGTRGPVRQQRGCRPVFAGLLVGRCTWLCTLRVGHPCLLART